MIKIAVIQTAFPGDVILATPIFEALKKKHPDCRTTAVVRPESIRLIENNPHINNLIPYDKYGIDKGVSGIMKMARRLNGHDMAIIVQRHLRSALIAFLGGVGERIGYDNSWSKFLYTKRIQYRKDRHEVLRCLDLVEIDHSRQNYRPKIFIDDETKDMVSNLFNKEGIKSDFAVVAPGSVWPTKRYPFFPELIQLISERLNLPSIMVGGKMDLMASQTIMASCAERPINITGRTDLLQSAAVISRARILFANDSAPAHMAAALGTPVIAIFGPTVPQFGFTPYSDMSMVVDIGDLYCRPCTSHGSNRCPEKHFRCMRELEPSRVIDAACSLIEG